MGVTIKDVARAAGTSVSTVSKVLNGHYSISEETAQRVRRVMEELNYYPSASAQSIAKGQTKTVTVLADLSPNAAFTNPHTFEIIAGLEETLQARGYRLILRSAEEQEAAAVAEDIISRRSADAIAVHVSLLSHPLSALLTRKRFPHIVLGAPTFESQVCWIDNNNVYSGTVAASYLAGQGYRNIAFLGGQYYDLGSARRLEGVKQGLQDAGVQMDDRCVWLGESTPADGRRLTELLLDSKAQPDAIICANNYLALGCVSALRERGLEIPGDIGVLTFDDYPFSRFTEPPLTVVDIDVRDMGHQAGKFLVQMIRNPNTQVQTYVTTSNLIERGSAVRAGKGG